MEFELLFHNKTPLAAIKSSWNKTRPFFWILLAGFIILAVFLIAPLFVIGPMLEGEGLVNEILDAIVNIVSTVLETLFTIFAYRVYRLTQDMQTT